MTQPGLFDEPPRDTVARALVAHALDESLDEHTASAAAADEFRDRFHPKPAARILLCGPGAQEAYYSLRHGPNPAVEFTVMPSASDGMRFDYRTEGGRVLYCDASSTTKRIQEDLPAQLTTVKTTTGADWAECWARHERRRR